MYCRGVPAFHDFEAEPRAKKIFLPALNYIRATRAEVAELDDPTTRVACT